MRIRSIRYGKRLLLFMTVLFLFFLFLLTQFDIHSHKVEIIEGSFLHRNIEKLPVGLGQKFHQWIQKHAFNFKWEEIHCVQRDVNKTVSLFKKWIPALTKQLNLKDGQSVFDSNIVCNEWFLALNSSFKGLTFGGIDENPEVLGYTKRIFKKFEKNFIKVDDMQVLKRVTTLYDHVINFGGVTMIKDDKVKCNIVNSLVGILKPGGSMYIGHNVEKNTCKTAFQETAVPPCFWNECLKSRSDIAKIYYINETDLFGKDPSLYDCYTGVFIHRKVCFMSQHGCDEPPTRYTPHPRMFYCSQEGLKSFKGSYIIDHAVSVMNKAGMGHKNLAEALRRYKEVQSNKEK